MNKNEMQDSLGRMSYRFLGWVRGSHEQRELLGFLSLTTLNPYKGHRTGRTSRTCSLTSPQTVEQWYGELLLIEYLREVGELGHCGTWYPK